MSCHSGYNKNNNTMSEADFEELLSGFSDEYSEMVGLAKKVGPAAFNEMLDALGGTKPHIPSKDSFWSRLARARRDEDIRSRFNGQNHEELAEIYGLSVRRVYSIVHHYAQKH